ncbi:MAG: hypothetical protein K1X57_13620 [Gemmataceae bacterium]|nr:hypothetical protein [Gemmataceae bacterium]
MVVKFTHLPLLYGDPGARGVFEEIVVHLVRCERPDTERVRIVRGDGGIDAHEGKLTDPTGVDVFQVKYFPKEIGDSQKAQIRDAFKTVREATDYKARSWTLCLPIDLGIQEKIWFQNWRNSVADSGVSIRTPWGAFELEGLLFQKKNQHLIDRFFEQGHQTINAAVFIQSKDAISISEKDAVKIGPNGITIVGPTVVDAAPPQKPHVVLSEIEFQILQLFVKHEELITNQVAGLLKIPELKARFYLDELSRKHGLVSWFGNMDRDIPDRYMLNHEGRRFLVEKGFLG